jgi:hypothetical protein
LSIAIPDSVRVIESYTLAYCESIQNVTLGSGVELIKSNAFNNSNNIIKLYVMSPNPPQLEDENAFDDFHYTWTDVYVPKGSLEKYKKSKGWKKFKSISELSSTKLDNINVESKEIYRYTLDGQQTNKSRSGIVIVKMDDGTTKKIIVRH